MKCWSRSTLGVVVGILNILVNLACIIYSIITLGNINAIGPTTQQQRESISLYNKVFSVILVVCVIMAIVSGIFIRGIIKRRHKLMMPWLILSGIGFVLNCGQFLFTFIGTLFQGYPLSHIVITLIVGLLSIGISALILWPIFTLFGDIRKKNTEQIGRVTDGRQAEYHQTPTYYNKA
ncbi:uncharacterized protein LOC135961091 [Calliphora vicina]|uniref:uncharacterized protein LOC135961091 n=1 Tax=Calliphora vicina TaxID=7373 RepID=UPI00325AE40E